MSAVTSIGLAIQKFVQDLIGIPVDRSLDGVLENALAAEHKVRALFASDLSGSHLKHLDLGLIDVFMLHPTVLRTRARPACEAEKSSDHYVFPIDAKLRRPALAPSITSNFATFQRRWQVFTHGALSEMSSKDWSNVLAAGGSVLACLMASFPEVSDRSLNNYYQSKAYASADIDLFLWGLSPEEAKIKMKAIYRAVCRAAPGWNVTCVRKVNTVSIHTTYPNRPIQIILRLYRSPAEILAGFDIDACCCSYDGARVWVNPRSLASLVRQANTVDMTRRSPSYEIRLAKYAEHGFEIYIPSLRREEIKPWIYSRDLLTFPNGLARLLVLETGYHSPQFYRFLKYPKVRYLQHASISQDLARDANDLPSNNYDGNLSWSQIPYGILWDAERIEKMVAYKDAWLNSSRNPYNQGNATHKHILFAGTMEQCLTTFCAECEISDEADGLEMSLGVYIKGSIRFITADPGQQLITGSFQPFGDGEWTGEVYRGLNAESLDERAPHPDEIFNNRAYMVDTCSELLPAYSA